MPNSSKPDSASEMRIPNATRDRRVWLRVGTLFDGSCRMPLRNAHLVYDSEGIQFVGGSEQTPPPQVLNPEQKTPDLILPGFVAMPGLIEAHAHLFLEGGELNADKRAAYLKQSQQDLLVLAMKRLAPLVRYGVIGVRDAGDKDGVGLALSKLNQQSNHPLMPYLDSPGAAIHHRARYGSFMAEPIETCGSLFDCVESRVKAGADRIKLIPTGIINFKAGRVTTEPQFTTEETAELVRAAKSFGKQTFAHASGDDGIQRAIDGSVDSVEHGFFVRDDQLAQMRDRQIAWVPTFAPVQKQVDHAAMMGWDSTIVSNLKRILDQHAASLVRAHKLGVRIIAGSDAGSYGVAHGDGLLYELELMERAGLSPSAVLHTATGSPAERLAFREKFGKLGAGFRSRFILTTHSPLERISNLRRGRWVVYDGEAIQADENPDYTGM